MFKDRTEAGQILAKQLEKYREKEPVILALPRGGLPIGYEVAKALGAPLDILLVRKIGTPGSPELAAGAVVDGDEPELVLNEDIVKLYDIPGDYIEKHEKQQLAEIERRRALYLEGRPPLDTRAKTVIIVDDGIATGATIRAAVHALKRKNPKRVIVAVPVAPPETVEKLASEADEVICLAMPVPFYAVGAFYQQFDQLTDEDVVTILRQTDRKNKS
ncbi:phosphoribosyltransferase [Emcibacter nanhaiensis]|uniref:Phosphoribosyltransferase n=1 Tax=Emcibacter nanhaiensis TaxID=1505037 RepID=A0A501PFF5_9PROT|nr:phosphoribosyltransferase [Emcibacter nanhaiensis]TPD58878.1 phosphoribosyltransferase [Emcibacter nanhaiensis]